MRITALSAALGLALGLSGCDISDSLDSISNDESATLAGANSDQPVLEGGPSGIAERRLP